MHWLSLGLISMALSALIGTTDKVFLERFYKNPIAYPFFTAFFLGIFCLLIMLVRIGLNQFTVRSFTDVIIAMMPGILFFVTAIISSRVMLQADASTVYGASQIGPIFSLGWGTIIFGNIFLPVNYIGLFIVVACAMLLTWEGSIEGGSILRLNKVIWWVIIAALFRSLSEVFLKIAVSELDFWDAFALSRLGMLLPLIYIFSRRSLREQVLLPIRLSGGKVFWMTAVIQVFALINLMILTLAFSKGPLALVSTTQSITPLFVIFFSAVFNYFHPGIVPLRNKALSMAAKVVISLVIVFGVYMLYVGH